MSSVIRVCPACGKVSSMILLPREALEKLLAACGLAAGITFGWGHRAYWCADCETPWLALWPAGAPKGERRQLVGLPADLVEIEEERGT